MYHGAGSGPALQPCRKLPILALNEVFIGESLSARLEQNRLLKNTFSLFVSSRVNLSLLNAYIFHCKTCAVLHTFQCQHHILEC